MKRILLVCFAACLFNAGFAQEEKTEKKENDTIRIGGMIIIKKAGTDEREIITGERKVKYPAAKKSLKILRPIGGSLISATPDLTIKRITHRPPHRLSHPEAQTTGSIFVVANQEMSMFGSLCND